MLTLDLSCIGTQPCVHSMYEVRRGSLVLEGHRYDFLQWAKGIPVWDYPGPIFGHHIRVNITEYPKRVPI